MVQGYFFNEALNFYNFTRCQRADGSFYGSRGKCRKGRESLDQKIREAYDQEVKARSEGDVEGAKRAMRKHMALVKQQEESRKKKDLMAMQLRRLEDKLDEASTLKEQQRISEAIKSLVNRVQEYDFTTCQRPDGTTYGTSGKCRKGVQIYRVETGIFLVKDEQGNPVGSIRTDTGGGAVSTKDGRSTARYTASVQGKGKKGNLTLAQAKTWVRDQLGEKTGGDAKIAIQGGLSKRGKERRLKKVEEDIRDVKEKFNRQVKVWNSIPKEERRNHPDLKRNIEYLRTQHERLISDRKTIQGIPVV